MTEAEWLTSNCPYPMFEFIRRQVSRRRLRLFVCGCCRRIWEMIPDERSRTAVELSERYADGGATKGELSAAQSEAAKALSNAVNTCKPLEAEAFKGFKNVSDGERGAAWERYYSSSRRRAAAKAAKAVARSSDRAARMAEEMNQAYNWVAYAEFIGHTQTVISSRHSVYCDLLRCVFGNPFRPAEFAAECVTPDVVHLADTIYDERAYDRLPVLADALEKAGCKSADVLAHCRGTGPHTRGCWVLDLIRSGGREAPVLRINGH